MTIVSLNLDEEAIKYVDGLADDDERSRSHIVNKLIIQHKQAGTTEGDLN